jgi:PEP-CTERM motif-containing protein
MRNITVRALAAVAVAGASVPASSAVIEFGSSGDYFEYVSDVGVSWSSAATAAASLTYDGATGYLATPTSSAMNSFLYSNFNIAGIGFAGAWLGGEVFGSGSGGAGYWESGPLTGQQFSIGGSPYGTAYSDWGGIEPNNAPSAAYMNIGSLYAGISGGQWADAAGGVASAGDPVQGYFVEFSVVPEPSTWAMMLIGFAGLGIAGYRRTKNSRAAISG